MRKRLLFLAALVVAAITVIAGSAMAGGTPVKASVVYNSIIPNGPPSNLPSEGPEAYAFNEFGNAITLEGTARHLNSVTVTLSSWACFSGSWNAGNCSTPTGSTFSQPVTLNIYDPSDTVNPIATSTQTFAIPYRPSASAKCAALNFPGKWYSSGTKTCFNGLADNVTFGFSGVTLPNSVVYGIVYNTRDFGPNPTGVAGPYDSLNIALSTESDESAGSSVSVGTIWQNSPYASQYCDNGVNGVGTFRADSPGSSQPPCWSYVPAVQFKAGN
jgi:hypothetical protein